MDTFGNTVFSGTSNKLVDRLIAKEITHDEFMRECAYWALKDGFDDLRPYPLPSAPTTEAFREYDGLPPERQLKVAGEFFLKNPEINEYFNRANSIKWKNKYILDWLKEIRAYIPAEDELSRRKIDNRIIDFIAFFDDNPLIVEKIKNTFQAKEIKQSKPYSLSEVIGSRT